MLLEAWWLVSVVSLCEGVQTAWRPLHTVGGGTEGGGALASQARAFLSPEHCNLHKVVMRQESYYQYVQYKTRIPDLKEFTLCSWHKFYNHSRDHPIFSYALKSQPRGIVSWVANNEQSSFYSMAILGHTIYRINYPVRLFRWYHACQSWNGRTGEWQLWINSERVGRGFYNIVAGKIIKGGGLAMTGQEQRVYGAGFPEGHKDGGLLGEVTLVQVYKAALTAGKAYTDHKHHHAHKFHHEDMAGEDDPEGGQRGGAQATGGQSGSRPAEMPRPAGGPRDPLLVNMQLVPRLPVEELAVRPPGSVLAAADVLAAFGSHSLFKRDKSNETESSGGDEKRRPARRADGETKKKRTLEQTTFGLIPGVDLSGLFTGEGFSLGAGGGGRVSSGKGGESGSKAQPEPAEWEVRSIMELCSGCAEDPFRKANVLSWRESSKKVFGGAHYVQAHQECHNF